MEIGIKVFFSVTKAFHKQRMQLHQIVNSNASFTSKEVIYHSKQLDHFVNLFQNKKLSELTINDDLEGSKLTIKMNGQLDVVTSETLTSYVENNKKRWSIIHELYINLVDLNFFDTSGIQSLISLILEARNNHISIKTIITSKTAFEILSVMGIPNTLKQMNCGNFEPI